MTKIISIFFYMSYISKILFFILIYLPLESKVWNPEIFMNGNGALCTEGSPICMTGAVRFDSADCLLMDREGLSSKLPILYLFILMQYATACGILHQKGNLYKAACFLHFLSMAGTGGRAIFLISPLSLQSSTFILKMFLVVHQLIILGSTEYCSGRGEGRWLQFMQY